MNTKELFKESLEEVSPEIKAELDLSFAIADKIGRILTERGLSQKEFARKMKKTEAEVSRWLTGRHNFTIRTIARISVALDVQLLEM